ncbi:MAG: Asp-tRNA(Asn)/Glu-tRNA(Gln) amidotransferase subunit GatB, partial [Acidobacteria bacterium]
AEIVTAPDFRSSWQAYDYVNHVRRALQWVGASDADMEKGNLRCEANVSVRKIGEEGFRPKVELKNLNSVRFMQKAIEYEINRQIDTYENGNEVFQETRLWDEKSNTTKVMRSKEEAHDYRYFPEPDLPPLVLSEEWIEKIKAEMPELPDKMRDRFIEQYELSFADASLLVSEKSLAEFYEKTVKLSGNPKMTANFVLSEFLRELNTAGISAAESLLKPEALAELIKLRENDQINNNQAKEILVEMFKSGKSASEIIKEKGYEQISDASIIERFIDEVIEKNPTQVEAYRQGNQKLFGFLVGQVMKLSQGKANPKIVNELLRKKL